jgi:hypothetical protein
MINFLIKVLKFYFIRLNLLCLEDYQIAFDLIFLTAINIILKIAHKANN